MWSHRDERHGPILPSPPPSSPTRGYLEDIKKLTKVGLLGEAYPAASSATKSQAAKLGQAQAIAIFRDELQNNTELRETLWTLAGAKLVCRSKLRQECHGDVVIEEYAAMHPMHSTGTVFMFLHWRQESWTAWLVPGKSQAPPPGRLRTKALYRQGPAGAARASRLMISSGYTTRQFCDGQSLASPRSWPPPHSRRYPRNSSWLAIADCCRQVATRIGTPQLLMKLVLGKVESSLSF